MKREEPVSCCQKTRPSIPTLGESPAMLPDFRKTYRSAQASGSLPSRGLGIWSAILAVLLGLAIPSQARERTTFVDDLRQKARSQRPRPDLPRWKYDAGLVRPDAAGWGARMDHDDHGDETASFHSIPR